MEKERGFIGDEEIDDAARALIGWFKSQELGPIDVIPVCIKIIAFALHMMGVKEHHEMDKACDTVSVELMNCMQGKQ